MATALGSGAAGSIIATAGLGTIELVAMFFAGLCAKSTLDSLADQDELESPDLNHDIEQLAQFISGCMLDEQKSVVAILEEIQCGDIHPPVAVDPERVNLAIQLSIVQDLEEIHGLLKEHRLLVIDFAERLDAQFNLSQSQVKKQLAKHSDTLSAIERLESTVAEGREQLADIRQTLGSMTKERRCSLGELDNSNSSIELIQQGLYLVALPHLDRPEGRVCAMSYDHLTRFNTTIANGLLRSARAQYPDSVEIVILFGVLQAMQQQYDDAAETMRLGVGLGGAEQRVGNTLLFAAQLNLATIHMEWLQLREADLLMRSVFRSVNQAQPDLSRKEVLQLNHIRALCIQNAVVLLSRKGDTKKDRDLLIQLSWIMRACLRDHIRERLIVRQLTAGMTRDFARECGDDKKKERYFRIAIYQGSVTLKRQMKQLGPMHEDVLDSMNNLAVTLHYLEKRKEAADLLDRCIDLRNSLHSPFHPDGLVAKVNRHFNRYLRTNTKKDQKQKQDCVDGILKLTDLFFALYSQYSYQYLHMLYIRCKILYLEERGAEDVDILNRAVAVHVKIWGPEHQDTRFLIECLEAVQPE